MNTYHPHSYSQQARKMAGNLYHDIQSGLLTLEAALAIINNSYRADLVRHRAAKRLGRMMREGR